MWIIDYTVDFEVVNFSEGVDYRILYHICERFNLHKYTCYELWKMPAQVHADTYLNIGM